MDTYTGYILVQYNIILTINPQGPCVQITAYSEVSERDEYWRKVFIQSGTGK